jgi:hypothetical protein
MRAQLNGALQTTSTSLHPMGSPGWSADAKGASESALRRLPPVAAPAPTPPAEAAAATAQPGDAGDSSGVGCCSRPPPPPPGLRLPHVPSVRGVRPGRDAAAATSLPRTAASVASPARSLSLSLRRWPLGRCCCCCPQSSESPPPRSSPQLLASSAALAAGPWTPKPAVNAVRLPRMLVAAGSSSAPVVGMSVAKASTALAAPPPLTRETNRMRLWDAAACGGARSVWSSSAPGAAAAAGAELLAGTTLVPPPPAREDAVPPARFPLIPPPRSPPPSAGSTSRPAAAAAAVAMLGGAPDLRLPDGSFFAPAAACVAPAGAAAASEPAARDRARWRRERAACT